MKQPSYQTEPSSEAATGSEARHTPGPWSTCHDGCSCGIVSCADHPVATVTRGKWGDTFPSVRLVGESSLDLKAEPYIDMIEYGEVPPDVAAANASLIAASPQLLEACKRLMVCMTLAGWEGDPAAEYARAAIAAATGTPT